MHADFKELVSLRDGEPIGADVGQHVSRCAHCRLELSRLTALKNELRQLPGLEPPSRSWSAIREELARSPTRSRRGGWMPLSAACVLVFGVALTLSLAMHRDREAMVADGTNAKHGDDVIGPLVTRSQQLEGILQNLPRRPTVERVATSATIDDLQTRIQLLDLQLSTVATTDQDYDRTQRLWNARVQLLSSLVSVRYAEAVRDGDASLNPLASGVI